MAVKVSMKARSVKRGTPKPKYSAEEKRAYDLGKAYVVGAKGGRVHLSTLAEENSFRAGAKSVGGRK